MVVEFFEGLMMRFVLMFCVCLFCGVAQAQILPVAPGPVVTDDDELVRLIVYRNQLVQINTLTQQSITDWLDEIKVHEANLTYLQSIQNPNETQQIQIAMLINQISQLRWSITYHMGLIDNRNVLIFQLNQQIEALMDAL
jgi:hypothetical protein